MIAALDVHRLETAVSDDVRQAVERARAAQPAWARLTSSARARHFGRLRPLLAENARALAQAAAAIAHRPLAEKLTSEVLPLVEAVRFLQRETTRILRPQKFGRRGRPLWLHGSTFEVQRRPHGVVLVVGPGNYPLFLPAVHLLQALAAGNAVVVKPAEGTSRPLELLHDILLSVFPKGLVELLPETKAAARAAVQCGIDKAIFTGSSPNGCDLLALLAETNVPSVMELSGADAVFVRADADVALAAKAICFGVRLNNGNTCMAPQTIFVHQGVEAELRKALILSGLEEESIVAVRDDADALELANLNEHGLGASIFSSDEKAAQALAAQLRTGFVTINDLIVPTADPRFPFGGVGASGFGITRGAEGLLEMTYAHVVATRRTKFLPHLEEPQEQDAELFETYLTLAHGRGWRARWSALRRLVQLCRERK